MNKNEEIICVERRSYAHSYFCSVRHYRCKAGLTQSQLADLVGTTKNTISRIERGESTPSVILAIKIVDVLGLARHRVCDVFEYYEIQQ